MNEDGRGEDGRGEDKTTPRILIIDDEKAVRDAFSLSLEDLDAEVVAAASGDEGIAAFSRASTDLVFLDLKMPGKNGVEVLREIRESDPDVPIYVVTAFAKEFLGGLKGVWRDGFKFDLIRKPVGAEAIVEITRSVLGASTRGKALTGEHVFKLFVVGINDEGMECRKHLEAGLAEALSGKVTVEIVDVLDRPDEAAMAGILATPALSRSAPPPPRTVIGDLTDLERILAAFGGPPPKA